MLDREACERRVYRLATLLTGNPIAAVNVISQVIDAQPDLRHLDNAHMDRLAVLRSREIKPAMLVHDLVPVPVAKALAALSAQQREAWVFCRIYNLDERDCARAMDCSVTAMRRHLDQADATMAEQLKAEAPHAAATLLTYSMCIDVPRFHRLERLRRRRMQIALKLLAAALVAMLLAALAIWWARPLAPD